YEAKGKENNFPLFERCPNCNSQGIAQRNVHRNGYYWRYGINDEGELYIPICRFRCLACKITISILPSFLVSYFHYTFDTMVGRLSGVLNGKKVKGSRQQLEQHMKRFNERIHWIHSFFRKAGPSLLKPCQGCVRYHSGTSISTVPLPSALRTGFITSHSICSIILVMLMWKMPFRNISLPSSTGNGSDFLCFLSFMHVFLFIIYFTSS